MQDEKTSVKEGLARIYRADYLSEPALPPTRSILDALFICADDVIVELGAGDGRFALPIARRLDALEGRGLIFACDFSKPLVDSLAWKASAEGVDAHVRSLCLEDIRPGALPFENGRVETVLAVNFLQYLKDPLPYIAEIVRIVADGGSLLTADWKTLSSVDAAPAPFAEFSVNYLSSLLNDFGMDALPVSGAGYNWMLRAVKPIAISV